MAQLLQPVAAALEEMKLWDEKDASSGAFLLLNGIRSPDFIISILSSEFLLSYTLPLSKIMQTNDCDLASAVNHAENVIDIVSKIRINVGEEFRKIFVEAQSKAELLGSTLSVPRLAKKQSLRCNVPAENAEEYYRRAIFLPWIDSFLSHISDRFLKHKNIFKNFTCLLPNGKTPTKKEKELYLNLAKFYREDIGQFSSHALSAQFELWHKKFQNVSQNMLPKNAIDALNVCNEDIHANVFTLLKIFSTLPVSTSTAERSFSTLRRIKTYLRNTMRENRLNGLANLNIHREIPIETDDVITVLQRKGTRRLNFIL